MKIAHIFGSARYWILYSGSFTIGVLGGDVLETSGFTTCLDKSTITISNLNVKYDRSVDAVIFDIGGSSSRQQNVTASLTVTAYGRQVYKKDFDPCDEDTKVPQLCPGTIEYIATSIFCTNSNYIVPAGVFAAKGSQAIPSEVASQIPSIAFAIPDLEGEAKLELKSLGNGEDIACIRSNINNGRTVDIAAVSYVAAGIAGAALLLTGLAALGSANSPGSHTQSPSFGDVIGWFQSMAMNGMLSVNYPPIYRSFTKNFAFSGCLVPWKAMQLSIDNFRKATGGNLTEANVQFLHNSNLVFGVGSKSHSSTITKRSLNFYERLLLNTRELSANVNGTQLGGKDGEDGSSNQSTESPNKVTHVVHGIQGYVEQLTIPQANTFMAVLLTFATVIAAIAVGILLLKVILETWGFFGSFPKKLTNFRKQYWGLLGRTITNLILILYGVWTLYCIYQFTNGDSWAAKLLAGITFALFTVILGVFTFRIWQIAQKFKTREGDASALFEDKETWRKYSLFYDNYKRGYWWLFMPVILYMFAKGCVLAAGNGHGLVQSAGQLIIESLMLIVVLWSRPYVTKTGNWINAFIQIVRVLSVICIIIFVEELGITQSTKTVTGVVLIAVQSVLTAVLAVLIVVNSIIVCCKVNPHRKRRKEAGISHRISGVI